MRAGFCDHRQNKSFTYEESLSSLSLVGSSGAVLVGLISKIAAVLVEKVVFEALE